MDALVTGSEAWWQARQAQGIPTVEPLGDTQCVVSFFWRDPAGDEQRSRVRHVWLYITGVTDHHQRSQPVSLSRIPGTDVWRWSTRLPATWRGSYCMIPSTREQDFSPEALSAVPDRQALREGWRKLLSQAIADPFNPHSWRGGRGHPVSALHLPLAPAQPGWEEAHPAAASARCIQWRSRRLGNQRRVWIFATGEQQPQQRPLAILLDGQFWAQSMPVWPALQAQTRAGELPPALYVLIDAIDNVHRGRELPCNPDFWLAVQEELLPLVRRFETWHEAPETTVVAGQSFGGLSALYAVLHWPERFGCALSQSGSFWWPHRGGGDTPGWLVESLRKGAIGQSPIKIFLEAGLREPVIHQAHQQLVPLLQKTQRQLFWREVDGGHDALCWRGGLIDGLRALWRDAPSP
ncbi:enterochelin esterase [Enterobacteriaceae bacterium BIT-l23]|uniref:enterochelin esterase n=1 Tax=Jejubacter sp. L23 TaxID=3092086 RepID=UPI0015851502|nr:enterochelin esterase [Enterobacteriaceae bacterium BIT-l23]